MRTWRLEYGRGVGITSCLEVHVDDMLPSTQKQSVCMLLSESFPKVVHQCAGERVCIKIVCLEVASVESSAEGLQYQVDRLRAELNIAVLGR